MAVERMNEYINISIGGFGGCKADTIIINNYGHAIFISMIGYSSTINMIKPMLNNKTHTMYANNRYYTISSSKYIIKTKKMPNSDYVHMIAYASDSYITKDNHENYTSYIFTSSESNIEDELYKRLVDRKSVV